MSATLTNAVISRLPGKMLPMLPKKHITFIITISIYLFFKTFKNQYYRQHGNKMPINVSTMRVSDVADSVAVRVRSATFTPH